MMAMMAMMRFGLYITVLDAVGEGTSILPVRDLMIRGEQQRGWE